MMNCFKMILKTQSVFGFNFHSLEDVFSREFHKLKMEHSGLCD